MLELLVVILIIGVLGAIALPHYQLVIDKAHFAKYQAMAASLRDAYDHYVLVHGVGTGNFDKLAISLPSDFRRAYGSVSSGIQCFQNYEMFCCMSDSGTSYTGVIDCGKNDLSVIYAQSFFSYNNEPANRKGRCLAEENHTRANRLCSALGTYDGIRNMWTPEGISNRYKNYFLN